MRKYFTLDKWVNILKKLAAKDVKLFNVTTLLKISEFKSEKSLRKSLKRLENKGLIRKVGPGLYLNSFCPADIEEIAMILGKPCYISFESALAYHSILSQLPMVLTCATVRKPFEKSTSSGSVVFRHISQRLFWGYEENKGILYAEPEKALLDWIYWNRKVRRNRFSIDELDWLILNKDKLLKYSEKFPFSVRRVVYETFNNHPSI